MKRPFLLKKRGKNWYYRLANEQTFHSTGQKSRPAAPVAIAADAGIGFNANDDLPQM